VNKTAASAAQFSKLHFAFTLQHNCSSQLRENKQNFISLINKLA